VTDDDLAALVKGQADLGRKLDGISAMLARVLMPVVTAEAMVAECSLAELPELLEPFLDRARKEWAGVPEKDKPRIVAAIRAKQEAFRRSRGV
jgi:hypothetical protein